MLTDADKARIDAMDYKSLLRRWRFAPVGDPLLQGETGDYYSTVMRAKGDVIGHSAQVEASKSIGWDNPLSR